MIWLINYPVDDKNHGSSLEDISYSNYLFRLRSDDFKLSEDFSRKELSLFHLCIRFILFIKDKTYILQTLLERWSLMVWANWRWRLCDVVEAIGISNGSVVSILNDHMGTRKLCGKWESIRSQSPNHSIV